MLRNNCTSSQGIRLMKGVLIDGLIKSLKYTLKRFTEYGKWNILLEPYRALLVTNEFRSESLLVKTNHLQGLARKSIATEHFWEDNGAKRVHNGCWYGWESSSGLTLKPSSRNSIGAEDTATESDPFLLAAMHSFLEFTVNLWSIWTWNVT